MGGEQRLAGERVTRLVRGLDQDRLAAERGQNVAVGRIARHRHGDAVARLEHRQEGQNEAAGGAGRHDDPLRADVAAIGVPIMSANAFAQRRDAERGGIVDPPRLERRMGGCGRRSRCAGRGLTDLHMDDMASGGLDPGRSGHDVHHHERGNIAAAGGLKPLPQPVPQCRIMHRFLLLGWRPIRPGLETGLETVFGNRALAPQTGRNVRLIRGAADSPYRVSGPPPIAKPVMKLLTKTS